MSWLLTPTSGLSSTPGLANPSTSAPATTVYPTTLSSSSNAPALPERPNSLSSVVNRTASNYSPYNTARYGSSPYGYGNYNSYASPYSRLGAGYGSMYGGYGGMYSGMGGIGGMGGMGGLYGGGVGGMQGNPNDPNSLTQSFSQSTQATFQVIESIVGAFGGFAQMLESTYMATHSSFFGESCESLLPQRQPANQSIRQTAMVSVAEQFGNLRQTLGSVLGIFTLIRWMRALLAKLTGRPPPASSRDLSPAKFAAFSGTLPDGSPAPPRPSKKPFIVFLLAVFGLPYLMGKLIRALARSQEEEERRRLEANPHLLAQQQQPLDPSKLEFCRVLYDFAPEPGPAAASGVDLAVKKGDLVAVLSKTDPLGSPSEWWRCRARDGRMGYLPSPYLEPIQRRTAPAQIAGAGAAGSASPAESRAQTMSGTGSAGGSRAVTMSDGRADSVLSAPTIPVAAKGPEITGKAGDISVESFQKGQFYS